MTHFAKKKKEKKTEAISVYDDFIVLVIRWKFHGECSSQSASPADWSLTMGLGVALEGKSD